jgi:hypothetical protein
MREQSTGQNDDSPADTEHDPSDATDGTKISGWSRLVTTISTLNLASFISLFVGLCYFYNYSYRKAYFGPFGLDAEVVPVSVPDAVVDGFFGIVANVLLVVAILAIVILVYVVLGWFATRYLERFARRLRIPSSQPMPHPAIVELGASFGFRTSYIASIIAIGTMMVSLLALTVIGVPAERAASKDVDALRARVGSSKARCARYDVKGSADLVGWRIGSAPDRQFILGNDDAVHVLRFDDLERLYQTTVPCKVVVPPKLLPRQPKL